MEAQNGFAIVRTTWNQFEIVLAERVGFEPTVPCGTPDFESAC
jgi:hypothetical protein